MVESESRVLDPKLILAQLFPGETKLAVALGRCDQDDLIEFIRAVYRECKNNPRALETADSFYGKVIKSDRSMDEWLQEILVVYRWLHKQGLAAKLSDVVEYASCAWCGDSTGGVQAYLESYGFERSFKVVVSTTTF